MVKMLGMCYISYLHEYYYCLFWTADKLEDKPEITHSDSVMIQAHTERLNSLDSDFMKHHFTIIELVDEDQDTLERECAQRRSSEAPR